MNENNDEIIVKCGACGDKSYLKDWKDAAIKNDRFIGGCPTCRGEFYEEVME